MAQGYERQAIGVFELDSYLSCFVALDAAAKAAAVKIQGVERNRLKSGACVNGSGAPCGEGDGIGSVFSYNHRLPFGGFRAGDQDDDQQIIGF